MFSGLIPEAAAGPNGTQNATEGRGSDDSVCVTFSFVTQFTVMASEVRHTNCQHTSTLV